MYLIPDKQAYTNGTMRLFLLNSQTGLWYFIYFSSAKCFQSSKTL